MRRKGLLTTALVIAACSVPQPAKGAPPRRQLAPPVICTMHNRLDIFVDEDNILWACECEALKTGHICRWQVIGGVDATTIRKRLRHPLPPLPLLLPHV